MPGFSWDDARAALDFLPGGGLNIAHECVDRHARGARRDQLAIRCLGRRGEVCDLSYGEQLANRTSTLPRRSSTTSPSPAAVGVFMLLGRVPELYVAVLGTLKHGNVACALFSTFGPEPIRRAPNGDRAGRGAGHDALALSAEDCVPIRDALPALRHVLLVGPGDALDDTHELADLMAGVPGRRECVPTRPDDTALLHFTSGTTPERPRAQCTSSGAVLGILVDRTLRPRPAGRRRLLVHRRPRLGDGNVVRNRRSVGRRRSRAWSTKRSSTLHAVGTGSSRIEGRRVWYTAPTAVRMMMKAGEDVRAPRTSCAPVHRQRRGAAESRGGVLGERAFGLPIHDNWWQTETGAILIANYPIMNVRPGSMGRPLPGSTPRSSDATSTATSSCVMGAPTSSTSRDSEGELALRPGWPSMFRGYLHEDARYAACFAGGWYRSGDLARRDADGYFWFVGRADDVIKSAGHLIGPFEVESALMEHPSVAEAGVIGIPDPIAGAVVKAFVVLRPQITADDALRLELIGFARKRLGAAVAPREIEFAPTSRRRAVARSCVECSGPASSASTSAMCPPSSRARARRRPSRWRTDDQYVGGRGTRPGALP